MFEAERVRFMSQPCVQADEQELAAAISAAIVELDASLHSHHRTMATTYIDDKIVLCVLESIQTKEPGAPAAKRVARTVRDARVALQAGLRGESTRAVERLTGRRVKAFKISQAAASVAWELFLLDSAPLAPLGRRQGLPS